MNQQQGNNSNRNVKAVHVVYEKSSVILYKVMWYLLFIDVENAMVNLCVRTYIIGSIDNIDSNWNVW